MENKGEKEEDFVISEDDTYGSKGEGYSFPSLIMSVLRKALEVGSREQKEGYWNVKFDKLGNAHRVWIPDQRKEFIQTIETLKDFTEREYDSEAEADIKKIADALQEKFKKYCEEEKKDWEIMDNRIKKNHAMKKQWWREGMLSEVLPYHSEYVEDLVKVAREELRVINKLIKRKGDFKEEGVEG